MTEPTEYAPAIYLSTMLRLAGADLIEMAGRVQWQNIADRKPSPYTIGDIEELIAKLRADFDAWKAKNEGLL